jgi:hypothetical protein
MIGRPQLVSDDRMGLRVSSDTPKKNWDKTAIHRIAETRTSAKARFQTIKQD